MDRSGGPEAQVHRQPPPKPPRRNRGRVTWLVYEDGTSAAYPDWPPPEKGRPQEGPAPQEPDGKLQPVQDVATGSTHNLEEDMTGTAGLFVRLGQVPPSSQDAEAPEELCGAQPAVQKDSMDRSGGPEAQGLRQPPPKPPRRNRGRVTWLVYEDGTSAAYTDWPPPEKGRPQEGPAPQEPDGKLQPVQDVVTGSTHSSEEDMPGTAGLFVRLGQVPPSSQDAEAPEELCGSQPAVQVDSIDRSGGPEAQVHRQPSPKPPRRNRGRVTCRVNEDGISAACLYTDWPPPEKGRPQEGPAPQEPDGKLQPVQDVSNQHLLV